jgi:Peptidase family M48
MRRFTALLVVLLFGSLPLFAQQPASALDQVLDRIVAQEKAEVQMIRGYSPMVETYIQLLAPDKNLGTVPNGDKYFLGRAKLENGVELVSLANGDSNGSRKKGFLGGLFGSSMEFVPEGFLQMVYIDADGFDRQHYQFDYVRREFLGEVRALVFDVTPKNKNEAGRFAGRIWVEDQDFHVVRFNGAYTGSKRGSLYFHFDSWRVNADKNDWLPAFIYSEENDIRFALSKKVMFKAQTRLWGYDIGQAKQEQELSKILVEASTPVNDQTTTARDISPLQAQRSWDRQAEDNVVDRMERLGLLSPPCEVDKVLETVVNNLEVTNNLDIQPEVRCRVVMTTTLESFTIGHTIVLSRGLIDVLPDEASLAAVIAHELAHTVLGHRIDTDYAFFDRMLFDDQETFRHFGFARTPEEEAAATAKAAELLAKSPYKDQLGTAEKFAEALEARSKQIPNLISPHLGNTILAHLAPGALPAQPASPQDAAADPNLIVALPLGGRIKLDPWNDDLTMLKAKPVGAVAEREKMPFEVTPFILFLTRDDSVSMQTPGAVSAQSETAPNSSPTDPR